MIRIKQLYLIVFLLLFLSEVHAQEESKVRTTKNTVYFEVLGNAYLYSFNYERSLIITPKITYSARIGVSTFNFLPEIGNDTRFRFFPLTLNLIRHFNKNNLEVGIGMANELSGEEDRKRVYKFIPTLHTGYRRYLKNNLDFRAGVNLSRADLNPDNNYEVFPWPYLSIGMKF